MTRMSHSRLFARATMFLLSVVCPLWSQTNLLTNGDFSQGNIGFRSEYTYSATDCTPGEYYSIGTNPYSCNGSAPSFGDHTTGTGLMMIVNGAQTPGLVAWEETVSVLPGKSYFFRGWVADWGNDNGPQEPARLMVIINDLTISTVIPDTRDGHWSPFNVQWESQSSTSAKIQIVDADLAWYQNDFALDDLSFATTSPANSSAMVFENAGGTLKTDGSNISLSNSKLTRFSVLGSSHTGTLGTVTFTTGVLSGGNLGVAGTFEAGGSLVIKSNGTGGLPKGLLFAGTFSGPVTWVGRFKPAANGTKGAWRYTLSGQVQGTFFDGLTANGGTVQFSFHVSNGSQFAVGHPARGKTGGTTVMSMP
jgi:hypothetical protein